jgi:membrane protease YdiL (CAAX protease family)
LTEIELKHQEANDFKKLLSLLAKAVIAVVIAEKALAYLIFGLGWERLPAIFENLSLQMSEEALRNLLYFLLWLFNDIVVYVPPLVIFGLAFGKKLSFQKAGEPYSFKKSWILPIFVASYALSAIASYISYLLSIVFQAAFGGGGLVDVFADVMPQSTGQLIIMLIMVGLLGPILEEIIYRHLLLRPLRRFGDFYAVIITSLLFGFFHGNLTQFLYTTAGGVLYGIVAVKANSVKPAIVMHIINNTYSIFYLEFLDIAEISENSDLRFVLNAMFYVMLVLGVILLIYFIAKKHFKTENFNPYLLTSERVRITAEHLLMLVMWAVLIMETIGLF